MIITKSIGRGLIVSLTVIMIGCGLGKAGSNQNKRNATHSFADELQRADGLVKNMQLGLQQQKIGNYKEAVRYYLEADKYSALTIDHAMVEHQLAEVYEKVGDYDHAIASYRELVKYTQNPKDVEFGNQKIQELSSRISRQSSS